MARPRSTNVSAGADGIPGGVGEGIAACSSVQVIASILTMSPAHRYAEARSTPVLVGHPARRDASRGGPSVICSHTRSSRG